MKPLFSAQLENLQKRIYQLEEQLHSEMQLKDELEQKCRCGTQIFFYKFFHFPQFVFKHGIRTRSEQKNLGQVSAKLAICVPPRASHTKLEKIMKELDEEVKFQDCFFTLLHYSLIGH